MDTANVRWPDSLWAAVTPAGARLPNSIGTRRPMSSSSARLYRPVDRAASARGGRRCRDRRSGRAGLGRVGAQQRPGDPDAVAARSGRHRRQARRGRRTLRRAAARQRLDAVRCRAALQDPGRAGAGRLGSAGAFARPHQDRRTPRAAMVEIRRAGRIAVARADAATCWARMPGSAASGTGPAATSIRWRCRAGWRAWCSERGGRIYARSPAISFERPQRSLGGQDGGGRDQRPRADRGDQRLYRRILEIAGAGHRARSDAGAVLADGDAAAVRQCARPSFPAGRRCPIPMANSTFARYDARNRLVTGGAVIGPGNKVERIKARSRSACSGCGRRSATVSFDYVWNGYVGMPVISR
jgi:hypothetical protein